jgi:lipoate-protein ligase B
LNLAAIRRDVVWYVRVLEEVMIRTSGDFGVVATREAGKTGVWVAAEKNSPQSAQGSQSGTEKLGAIGVHISRWVTSHGLAYNVSTDLRYFDLIVPCGIAGRKATSLEKLLGHSVDSREVAARLKQHFGEVFNLDMQPASLDTLLERLRETESSQNVTAPVAQPILAVRERVSP